MDGLILFLGSIAFVVAVFSVVTVIRNKEVFFPNRKRTPAH